MHRMRFWVGCLLLAGLVSTSADARGWRIGAAVGGATLDEGDFDAATAYSVYTGFTFNPWLGVQLSYVNIGDFEAETGRGEIGVLGYEAAVTGHIPFNGLSLLGKAGLFKWNADARDVPGTGDDSGTEGVLGIGGEYRLDNGLAVRLTFDRYSNIGDADLDVLAVGLNYAFE